ncbi:MAG: dicarboxylate/amino acid:cation symporter [Holosporales bacterium]|jgi:Na+/H+-dicarboxylate symporter|nr:dicarboxylate/amino acid:cation symporter [Holosporales bacterium]
MFLKKILNLPFGVLFLFLFSLFFGNKISEPIKSQLYAISLCLKDLIVFILPFLIFSLVTSGVLNLKNKSLSAILILVPLVCFSNFLGFWISYIFTAPILKNGILTVSKLSQENVLLPAWKLPIGKFVSNDIALLLSICVGFWGNFIKNKSFDILFQKLLTITNFILKKVIRTILPLFILGFILKMQYDNALVTIIKEYSKLLLIMIMITYGYILMVIHVLSKRKLKVTLEKFKNLLPGILVGFFSMSSATAIPITIEGCKKNLKDKDIANFIVPLTANMHLLGDCFAIPIISLALIISFGYEVPSLQQYLVFSLYGVVAKFAAAGIPGGSAIIFVPLLENIFGFSAEMLTAITAIYVLFDPFATSANVLGHGMFASLFEATYYKVFKNKNI